ncbi:hypothetical protein B0H13DRAFT_1902435 [Mycena leptocephala]|nr:hypothetical protein B0H13DRAFT_1902435 [Mycena leptocephala]
MHAGADAGLDQVLLMLGNLYRIYGHPRSTPRPHGLREFVRVHEPPEMKQLHERENKRVSVVKVWSSSTPVCQTDAMAWSTGDLGLSIVANSAGSEPLRRSTNTRNAPIDEEAEDDDEAMQLFIHRSNYTLKELFQYPTNGTESLENGLGFYWQGGVKDLEKRWSYTTSLWKISTRRFIPMIPQFYFKFLSRLCEYLSGYSKNGNPALTKRSKAGQGS